MATIVGTLGPDILNGVNGQDNLIYGDTSDTLSTPNTGGNDTITGGANATNNIFGDAETLMGHGATGGNDTLIGGVNSTNLLVGDANSTEGAPIGGNDTLIGGIGGTNTLVGDFVNRGGGAEGGNDRLVSADNTTDNMWGDFQFVSGGTPQFGQDTFVFSHHNGNDLINDFHQGEDFIEIDSSPIPTHAAQHIPPQAQAGNHILETFSDLNIEEVNGNSVIHFDANNSVTVLGVTGLTASDFHFVV
jgi:hypothetical protein